MSKVKEFTKNGPQKCVSEFRETSTKFNQSLSKEDRSSRHILYTEKGKGYVIYEIVRIKCCSYNHIRTILWNGRVSTELETLMPIF
jgi:hypothetical protein